MPAHTSASQLTTYAACPRRYELKYVSKIAPERRGTGLALGSAVHGAIEWYFEERLARAEPRVEQVLTIFEADLGAGLATDNIEWRDATPATLRQEGLALVRLFLAEHRHLDVVATEVPFELPLVDDRGRDLPRTLIGYLDLQLRDGTIIELKAVRTAYSTVACRTNLQFGAYRTAALHRGVDVELVALVRNRTPRTQRVTLPRDRDLSRWFVSVAAGIETSILSGHFPATPGPMVCATCDYAHRCLGLGASEVSVDAA